MKERAHRILIIDDEERAVHAIKRILSRITDKYEVSQAATTRQARKAIRELGPFDLAIVDERLMSGTSGLSILGPAKPLNPWLGQTRVIVYTAYPEWVTARAAYEAGANAYISKTEPQHAKKLRGKAKQLLELGDVRETVRLGLDAQKAAHDALRKRASQWAKKYGGKLLLVRDGKVLSAHSESIDAYRQLAAYTRKERLKIGIVEVPPWGEGDAKH